jgi:hypothetical protein
MIRALVLFVLSRLFLLVSRRNAQSVDGHAPNNRSAARRNGSPDSGTRFREPETAPKHLTAVERETLKEAREEVDAEMDGRASAYPPEPSEPSVTFRRTIDADTGDLESDRGRPVAGELVAEPHAASVAPRATAVVRDHRMSADVCACRLREVLDERQIGAFELQWRYHLDERDVLEWRTGRLTPTPEQKLALLQALNTARPKSQKPKLRYEDVFGHTASPRNCTCGLRRLLDSHGLTAQAVATNLAVEKKVVLGWRAGRGKPTPAQLEQIHALASRQPLVVEFRRLA